MNRATSGTSNTQGLHHRTAVGEDRAMATASETLLLSQYHTGVGSRLPGCRGSEAMRLTGEWQSGEAAE